MNVWFFASSLGLVTALTAREVRRFGTGRVLVASAAWIALAAVTFFRGHIIGMTSAELGFGAGVCYSAVIIGTGARPVLIMDQLFEKGELSESEQRRGRRATWLVLSLLTIVAVYTSWSG